MPRIEDIGGGSLEDDPRQRLAGDDPIRKELADLEAWHALRNAFVHLRQRAFQGDERALEWLASHAAEICEIFDPPGQDSLPFPAMREGIERLAGKRLSWPAMISADYRDRQNLVDWLESLKLGSGSPVRIIRKARKGRPAEDRREGSPSWVAKLLVLRLEGLRRELAAEHPPTVEFIRQRFSEDFLDAVRALPDFAAAVLPQWTEAAIALALVHRDHWIPAAWDEEAASEREGDHPRPRGKNAHARKKITEGMAAVVP